MVVVPKPTRRPGRSDHQHSLHKLRESSGIPCCPTQDEPERGDREGKRQRSCGRWESPCSNPKHSNRSKPCSMDANGHRNFNLHDRPADDDPGPSAGPDTPQTLPRGNSPLSGCSGTKAQDCIGQGDFELAQRLHSALTNLPRDHSAWTGVRVSWAALEMPAAEIRYLLFWIAREAPFGPDDARETTFRLSQRIAMFLAEDSHGARQPFQTAKKCYGFRSKVAHGRWKHDPNADSVMAETETLIRRSMLRLLADQELVSKFHGKGREVYLDELVFAAFGKP